MKNVKQPRLLFIVICMYVSSNQLVAQFNNNHRYYIEIGYAGGTQFPSSSSVGVYGAAGFFLRHLTNLLLSISDLKNYMLLTQINRQH